MKSKSISEIKSMGRRKIYTIALKFLTLFGVIIIMAVMINSLFPVSVEKKNKASTQAVKSQTVIVQLASLQAGKMMLKHWNGKPVAVLKRMNPPEDFVVGEPMNSEWRSVNAEYFVFYNTVGAAQCPLYLMPDGEQLKDTCTGIMYNSAGKRVERSGDALQIPPYYFDEVNNTIVIGEWGSLKEETVTTEGTESTESTGSAEKN